MTSSVEDDAARKCLSHTDDRFDAIRREELGVLGKPAGEPLVGLALSGGGIRSASFCLGVLQALKRNKGKPAEGGLASFDYLSTVSGGGYIGSTITWLTHNKWPDHLDCFANSLRSRGSYLDPSHRLTMMSLAAMVLRTMIVGLFVYGGILTALLITVHCLGGFSPVAEVGLLADRLGPVTTWLTKHLAPVVVTWPLSAAMVLMAWFVVGSLYYALRTNSATLASPEKRYLGRISFQSSAGTLLTTALLAAAIGLLPTLDMVIGDKGWVKGASAVIGLLGAKAAAVSKFLREMGSDSKEKWYQSPLAIAVAAALAVYSLLMLAYLAATALALHFGWIAAVVVLSSSMWVGAVANINMMSLHRMYRDRLMEAFLPEKKTIEGERWSPATTANVLQLSALAQVRPYHLINTNVVLVDSTKTAYRGRGGDSYLLSPLYCGSKATGWNKTADVMRKDDGLTLATAMAISGAAVNANTGSDGQPGPLRNTGVSLLMSVFGLQLGYWVNNPSTWKSWRVPDYIAPGLSALFKGYTDCAPFHMLSDGGHFENLGIYELVRRRCDVIYSVDGSADPTFHFDDLGAAIEKIFADFGATITFDTESRLSDLSPSEKCKDFSGIEVARRGYAIGTISYPKIDDETPLKKGLFIYVKSTLVDGLPGYVYTYKAAHEAFPHESTADQFFDELQLESYRRLGEAIGDTLPTPPPPPQPVVAAHPSALVTA
ncbi:MAG: hypothetical protein HYU60_01380 [Magnetospirillum sp.]|nr:hypothetical protein [Magnetospirillum sp.]